MAPNRMQLHGMAMKQKESFKEYAQRWRELAAQVEPPLFENEITEIFMNTLEDPNFDRLVSSGATKFVDLVSIDDRIEKGMKNGKILRNSEALSTQKNFFGNFQKKKEGETSAIYVDKGRNRQRRP